MHSGRKIKIAHLVAKQANKGLNAYIPCVPAVPTSLFITRLCAQLLHLLQSQDKYSPNSQFLGVRPDTIMVSAHIQTHLYNMHFIHLLTPFIYSAMEGKDAGYGEQSLVIGSYFISELISSPGITILNYLIPLG